MYTQQLEEKDYYNIYRLLKVYDKAGNPVNYKIITSRATVHQKDIKHTQALFISDYACSLSNAGASLNAELTSYYREYMIRRFPDYEENLNKHLEKKANSVTNNI